MSLVTNVSNFIFSLYLKTQKELNFSIFLNFFVDTSLGRQILDLPFLDFNLTIIKTLVGRSSIFLISLKGIRNPQSFLFPKQSHINKWSISSIINEQPLSLLLTLLFSSFQREGIFLLSNILKQHLNHFDISRLVVLIGQNVLLAFKGGRLIFFLLLRNKICNKNNDNKTNKSI